MNKHFSDARYYLGRAGKHLAVGVREELTPVAQRVQSRLGREPEEPEPTRLQRVRAVLTRSMMKVSNRVDGRNQLQDAGDDRAA